MQEVWEEGYALNELKRRSAELLERKEEFERRRKRLANLKRAAKRGSGSGANGGDDDEGDANDVVDLDLAAEGEAIRSHLEQLKK
jgi:hypothetical protein